MARSVFTFDDVAFERRLAETIAWCAPRARAGDPKHSLRSEALTPCMLPRSRAAAVADVVEPRALMMTRDATSIDSGALRDGRLLVYFPDADLSDGAAEVASRGFFDVHNVPPWDSWIALANGAASRAGGYEEYIVAWVPPPLVDVAQAGIDVNVEECIAWLENTDVGARAELRWLLP